VAAAHLLLSMQRCSCKTDAQRLLLFLCMAVNTAAAVYFTPLHLTGSIQAAALTSRLLPLLLQPSTNLSPSPAPAAQVKLIFEHLAKVMAARCWCPCSAAQTKSLQLAPSLAATVELPLWLQPHRCFSCSYKITHKAAAAAAAAQLHSGQLLASPALHPPLYLLLR
jgi:hypothetical protein